LSVSRTRCERTIRQPRPEVEAISSATTTKFHAAATFTRIASIIPGRACRGSTFRGTSPRRAPSV
jgi:hypothetical protein